MAKDRIWLCGAQSPLVTLTQKEQLKNQDASVQYGHVTWDGFVIDFSERINNSVSDFFLAFTQNFLQALTAQDKTKIFCISRTKN